MNLPKILRLDNHESVARNILNYKKGILTAKVYAEEILQDTKVGNSKDTTSYEN